MKNPSVFSMLFVGWQRFHLLWTNLNFDFVQWTALLLSVNEVTVWDTESQQCWKQCMLKYSICEYKAAPLGHCAKWCNWVKSSAQIYLTCCNWVSSLQYLHEAWVWCFLHRVVGLCCMKKPLTLTGRDTEVLFCCPALVLQCCYKGGTLRKAFNAVG